MNNYRTRIKIIIGFVSLLVLLLLLGILTIRSGGNSPEYYWGMLIGTLPGIATWLYMYDTWEPVNLRPKDEKTKTLDPRLIGFVVAAGLIASRIFTGFFSERFNHLLMGLMAIWLGMTIGYMVVQLWRHR